MKHTKPSYEIPPVLRLALNAVEAALAVRPKVDAAIARNAEALAAAEADQQVAVTALAEAEAALALQTDAERVAELEAAADAACRCRDEAAHSVARLNRTRDVLYGEACKADAAVQACAKALQAELRKFRADTANSFFIDLHQACRPLAAMLERGHALTAVLGPSLGLDTLLQDVLVPRTISAGPINGRWAAAAEGSHRNLSESWQHNSVLKALYGDLLPLRDVERKVAAHRNFTAPTLPPAPYVVKSGLRTPAPTSPVSVETVAPPRSTWQPYSWEVRGISRGKNAAAPREV